MNHLIFCDEFGNTGPRLLDKAQPVFVYAFLVLSPEKLTRAEKESQTARRTTASQMPRLKSSVLWGSPKGLALYARIGLTLAALEGRVCLSIVEKRYQACAMIVETYLDPALHGSVPEAFGSPALKRRIADACYNSLSDSRIEEFLTACGQSRASTSRIGVKISETLSLHPDDLVTHAARHMETHPDRLFRYGEPHSYLPRNSTLPASQYLAFFPGLERVDAFLEDVDGTASLLRDTDSQFGGFLDMAFEHGQHLDTISDARTYGAQRQLTRIHDCRATSSTENIGIQLADLAAGAFGRALVSELRSQRLPVNKMAVVDAWRPTLTSPTGHYWMISDSMLDRLRRAVLGAEARD